MSATNFNTAEIDGFLAFNPAVIGQGYEAERVRVREEINFEIIANGITNTYPQQCILAVQGSATASACVKAFAEFIAGNGFKDEVFGNTIVSKEGYTANELLYMTAVDLAMMGGISWLLNFNMAGEVFSIDTMPFEQVRLGRMDEDGFVNKVRVWDDWARQTKRLYSDRSLIKDYKIMNPHNLHEMHEAIAEMEYEEVCPMVLFWHEQSGYYPKATIDSAFDDCLAEAKQSEFILNHMNNGFSASTVIVNKNMSGEEVYRRNVQSVQTLAGSRNAGAVGYLEGDLSAMDIATKQLDKDLEATSKFLRNKIRMAFNIPPILIGEMREGSFPNANELQDAFNFYNGQTKRTRNAVERLFKKTFDMYYYQANQSGDYSIMPKTFV